MSALAREIAKFSRWAKLRLGPDYVPDAFTHSQGEWECDYPDWPALYAVIETYLVSVTVGTYKLDDEHERLLLYALARDNEDERILELLERYPSIATQLAQAAVNCIDVDARWQAAVLMGRIKVTTESMRLLRDFLQDKSEYVRRRAELALQEIARYHEQEKWRAADSW